MAGKSQSTVESKVENANKRPAASLISALTQRIAIVVRERLYETTSKPHHVHVRSSQPRRPQFPP
jgi:hypothetical protein